MQDQSPHEQRQALFEANYDRLCEFAAKIHQRNTQDSQMVVCIDVDDPDWGILAMHLMPGSEAMWEDYRQRGMVPVARGIVEIAGMLELITTQTALTYDSRTRPPDCILCAVLGGQGGATIHGMFVDALVWDLEVGVPS